MRCKRQLDQLTDQPQRLRKGDWGDYSLVMYCFCGGAIAYMEVDLHLLIVGAGPMARAHALACRQLDDAKVTAVSRNSSTAEAFTAETAIPCKDKGLASLLSTGERPTHAIVAVPVEALLEASLNLLHAGVRNVLVEKPAGLTSAEVRTLADQSIKSDAHVYVAYNRRFYHSVQHARTMIEEDGGATSVRFDFTERSDIVARGNQSPEVKRNWLLANSSHVIDLAFFLAGDPVELDAHVAGSLPWHPAGAQFSGSGTTSRGALFSYHADWAAPGRWSVDVRTRSRRLLLEPLEELREQAIGSFAINSVEIPIESPPLKPGVANQLEAFLNPGAAHDLVTIGDHADRVERVYDRIVVGS